MIRLHSLLFLFFSGSFCYSQGLVFDLVFGVDSFSERVVSVKQVSSGFIFAGGYGNNDSLGGTEFSLSKISEQGAVVWTKLFGTENDDIANYMAVSNDSTSFVICGSTLNQGGNLDGFLIKVDDLGNEIFNQKIGLNNRNESFDFVSFTSDGGFILCGYAGDTVNEGNEFWVVKLDELGVVEFDSTYGGIHNDYAQTIREISTGGYVVLGDDKSTSNGVNYDIVLRKLDEFGNTVWTTAIGDKFQTNGSQSFIERSDGKFLIVGESLIDNTFQFELTVALVNQFGILEWLKSLDGSGSDAGFSVVEVNPNQFAITGYTTTNSLAGTQDVPLIIIDSLGNELSKRMYGGTYPDLGLDIQKAINNQGVLIGGFRGGEGGSDYNIIWVKDLINTVGTIPFKNEYILFPNPLSGERNIVNIIGIPSEKKIDVSVLNNLGQTVKTIKTQAKSGELVIDLGNLKEGIYFVIADSGGETIFSQKLVITH